MGTVHKFKRPPKNEKQFQGYRPTSGGPGGGPGGGGPGGGGKPPRRGMRPWQRSVIAWSVLVLLAVGFWAVGRL